MEKMMVGWPEKYQRETMDDEEAQNAQIHALLKPKDDEEVRSVSSTGGEKGTKLARFDLIPPGALEELAKHYGRGARKYDDNNWRRGYEWGKSFAAAMRHMWAFWRGEDIDPETGTPHVIAAAWHMFSLYEFMQEFPQFDTRYKK